MRQLSLLLICFTISFQLPAQQDKSEEAIAFGVTDASLIDQLMHVVPDVGYSGRETLKRQSIKSYMMPVRHAGNRGAEMSYSLASCLEFYVNLDKNYKVNLSPDYISLNLKAQQERFGLNDAFAFLAEDGTVSAAILPYEAPALTSAVYATPKFKIDNYLHVFRPVSDNRQKVFEVKKALIRGNPILVELQAGDLIRTLGEEMWRPSGRIDKTFPFIAVGFDEDRQAVEVMSCWGRTWGQGGYAWISYKDFGRYAQNGYVMLPKMNY